MSLFSRAFGRTSTYALGIVITAFVLDRTMEIASGQVWATANKGVSVQLMQWVLC